MSSASLSTSSSPPARPEPSASRSMTGFARVRRSTPGAEITLSIKSVNHRALDVHFHCPNELDPIENDMRAIIRRKLIRGHIEVRVSLQLSIESSAVGLNQAFLEAYVAAFRAAAKSHKISTELDLNAALRVPGMLGEASERDLDPTVKAAVLEALAEALDSLNVAREREAREMVSALMRHNDNIRAISTELLGIRSRAVPLFQTRLTERLRELLRSNSVDPQRLAQEVAMLVDRSDISEEISRLQIHSDQLGELLKSGGEIGKRMDFLLQEMNRETNTILSKTTGIGELGLRITDIALSAKAEIEKIREQSLNLE
jgi:uncharacterized protein (TIGR00255 family)